MSKTIYVSRFKEPSSNLFKYYVDKVFEKLCFLKRSYPNFKEWYYGKVIPNVGLGTREIIVEELDGEIVAVSIVKKSEEKKICTFAVFGIYQNKGIGRKLMRNSIEFLETNRPIITVSEENIYEFRRFLRGFGFEEVQQIPNYYLEGSIEYAFNGRLTDVETFQIA